MANLESVLSDAVGLGFSSLFFKLAESKKTEISLEDATRISGFAPKVSAKVKGVIGRKDVSVQEQIFDKLKTLPQDSPAEEIEAAINEVLAPAASATPAASRESSLKAKYEENRKTLAENLGKESNIMYHLQGFRDLPLSLRFSEKEWRALKAFVCTLPINDGGICDFENARKKLDKLSTEDLAKLHKKWVEKKDLSAENKQAAQSARKQDQQKRKQYTKALNQEFNKWMQEPYKYVRRPDGSTAVDVDVERQMISRGVLPDADLRRDFMSCLRDMPETRKKEEPCDDMPSTCCEPYSNEESNFVLENCSSMSEGYKRHFKGDKVGDVEIDDNFNFCDATMQKGKSIKKAAQKSRKSSRGRSSYSMSPSMFDTVSFGGSADSFGISTSPNFIASVERATSSRSIGADGLKNTSRYSASGFLRDVNGSAF